MQDDPLSERSGARGILLSSPQDAGREGYEGYTTGAYDEVVWRLWARIRCGSTIQGGQAADMQRILSKKTAIDGYADDKIKRVKMTATTS
jgi:hypothetical protein